MADNDTFDRKSTVKGVSNRNAIPRIGTRDDTLARRVAMRLLVKRSLAPFLCLLFASPAAAINIRMNFDSGKSASPSFDQNHAGLISLFDYAEHFYEDVFEDTHTVDINFWYDTLGGPLGRTFYRV